MQRPSKQLYEIRRNFMILQIPLLLTHLPIENNVTHRAIQITGKIKHNKRKQSHKTAQAVAVHFMAYRGQKIDQQNALHGEKHVTIANY